MALYRELDREVLRRLYVSEGLSLKQVADRLGPPATKRVVQRALELHRIELRPARPPPRKQELMSAELLERLYVDEGRSLPEVAQIAGVGPATVIARMRALGIEHRKGAWRSVGDREPMTRDLLHELRVTQKLSASEIARGLGYSPIRVTSALARHGLGPSPGAGATWSAASVPGSCGGCITTSSWGSTSWPGGCAPTGSPSPRGFASAG